MEYKTFSSEYERGYRDGVTKILKELKVPNNTGVLGILSRKMEKVNQEYLEILTHQISAQNLILAINEFENFKQAIIKEVEKMKISNEIMIKSGESSKDEIL